MKRNDHRVRVGITLSALASLLFVFVFSLNGALSLWRGVRTVDVTFRTVQGLRRDDPVHFHGVPCGRVAEVSFETSGAPALWSVAHASAPPAAGGDSGVLVRLRLEVPPEVRGYLRADSEATIEKTLTGVTVVQLLQGGGAPLAEGAALVGRENATLGEVTRQMNDAAVEVTAILAHVRAMVASAHERDLVVGLLADLQGAVERAEDFTELLLDMLGENRAALGDLVANGAETVAGVDGAVGEVEHLTARIKDWFLETRPHLTTTAEEVAKAATQASKMARELRSRPWRLLHSPSAEEEEKRDLYQALEAYAQGAVELRRCLDQARALAAAADAGDPADPVLARTIEELEARLGRQREFEAGFWERLDEFAD